ncbi:MAG TPA: TetR/AcrR family transcriptional regulator [Stellaceae bacterium]|jgi:AcrR family transcriptional regulator|nr:TetR/AcrR family transcriptional regulator [Stellaceae bacterium]
MRKVAPTDNNVNTAQRGSVRRQRRTPEEARRLILDTAQELIARTGPEGLRLQEIAAAAGISHPLILHHFGSREGLVRALTQQAVTELRDRLLAALGSEEYSLGQQLDRVFDVFRDGLAQRLAWLATVDPQGQQTGTAMVMRDIADGLHARRVAVAPQGAAIERADTESLIHLIAAAAFGDAIFGAQLRRSAGLEQSSETEQRFRSWFASLIREHTAKASK